MYNNKVHKSDKQVHYLIIKFKYKYYITRGKTYFAKTVCCIVSLSNTGDYL